ncbi:outer membrane receptor protein involved in Fe transport [Mucilaginibacter gracilis]|uniref:Outer membrane receptor protein involved in Fe transport n=1 Tax=Mucilaginibacter gracilis TaxID=423350 RepID=A0A495J366_9SPHI|nr:TonB-dependent receptor [Mucilaginibacter gracilis]RKR83377.1 outer membrane receptor protein involved in Fe transport [Mucilaginibacter gracilis]
MNNYTKSNVIQTLFVMTRFAFLVTIVSLTLTGILMAANVRSQNLSSTNITVKIDNGNIAGLLNRIEQQSGFTFSYARKLGELPLDHYETKAQPLSDLLTALSKSMHLTYMQVGPLIAIKIVEQVKPGKITGKVLDEKGLVLPGATIRVVETGQGIQSNVDGTYQLSLPPGTYTLEASYISYQIKRVTGITVSEGKSTPLDIAMIPTTNALNTVTITGDYKKSSVEGLYAKQKNNIAMTDGISAEQIARTPDKNIGETLKRISGVSVLDNKYVVVRGLGERYNGTMMNGQLMPSTELNRKQFSFDIIPSNMVDNVTVYKTITPDKSAEFGGGLVEVNTKNIPTENFLSISFGENYNDKTTGKNFRSLNIDSRSYFGSAPNDRTLLGRTDWKNLDDIRAAYAAQGSSAALFANNWKLYNYKPLPSPNLQASFGRVIGLKNNDQIGIIASASYRNTWQTADVVMSRFGYLGADGDQPERYGFTGKRYSFTTNLGGIAGIGYTGGSFKVSLQSTYLRTYDQQMLLGTGDQNDFPRAVGYYDQATQTSLLQNQLRGEKGFGKNGIKLDWLLSYTALDRQKPDNHQFDANYIGSEADGPDVLNSDFSIFNPRNRAGGIAQRNWSRSHENNLSWNLDLTVPVKASIGKVPLNTSFKTGYAGWQKDRLFWVANTNSVGFAGSDPQALSEAFDPVLHPDGRINILSFGDQYKNKANLHAGYVMLDSKIGSKFRLTGGLRGEYYDLNRFNTLLQRFVEGQIRQNNDLTDYSDVLRQEPKFNLFPSAGLTYSLTQKMNLRLSYAKSIIRPDLRELAYFNEFDYELGGIYQSNTPVRSTKIDNFDFRYEWYPRAGEILSFSLFYKKLKYPMEIYQSETSATYELRNDQSAKNKGIELEARKSLAFTGLPVLRNLTLYGNFTRLFAKVTPMTVIYRNSDPAHPNRIIVTDNPGPEVERPQAGASNYTYNAGIYYDDKAFSLSLSYNYITNRVFRASTVYQNSLFETPLPSFDGQATVNLLKSKAQIKLNISNLLNRAGKIYSKRDGPLSNTLLYEKRDFIDYQANPGRTYGLSFNYNF